MNGLKIEVRLIAWTLIAVALIAPLAVAAENADVIYLGQHIITVDEDSIGADAVAVLGENIIAVGPREEVLQHRSDQTRVIELGDQALLPGFIDAHGHVGFQSKLLNLANLSPPPVGGVSDVEGLQQALREYICQNEIPAGVWVVGFGYDDSLLAEKRHPNREDLDTVSTDHPVFILHTSGHLGAANSMALAKSGFSAESDDPPGGVIRRVAGSKEPDGVLEESAMWQIYMTLPKPSLETSVQQLGEVQKYYASKGITTVQEGGASAEDINILAVADSQDKLVLDHVAYAIWVPGQSEMPEPGEFGKYSGRFKLGGIKLVLDGSPQGKTAYLSRPYEIPPPGHDASYVGYPSYPPEVLDPAVKQILARKIALLAHANGDAASEMLINAVEQAAEATSMTDSRVVMIHAQSVRDDQLDRMAALGMIPSFFSAHTFFWGDWHRDSVFGPMRADRISPTASALERGIVFTVHNDAPVTPPVPIDLLWSTVNRRTRSGDILGPLQRISTYEAIKALTINGAYQYFEEDRKGSITAGKLADLVILSQDPLSTEPDLIRDIRVIETISHGRSVYRDSP